jgi:hypothetical protein
VRAAAARRQVHLRGTPQATPVERQGRRRRCAQARRPRRSGPRLSCGLYASCPAALRMAGRKRARAPRQQAVAQTLGNRTTSCAVRIVHAASQRFPSHHTGRIGRRVQLFRKTDSMYSTGYTPHGAPLRTALIRHPEASDNKDTHVSPTALDHTLFRGCRRARIAILRSFSVKAPSLHAPRHKMSGDSSRSATLAPFPVSRG